jgi:hypothetical protein
METKNPGEGLRVALPNPCGDIFQPQSVTRKGNSCIILL